MVLPLTAQALKTSRIACAIAVLAICLGLSDAPPAAGVATTLKPEDIYLRAVHAMKAAPVPPYVTFRETVAGRNFKLSCTSDGVSLAIHHGDVTGAYDVSFRTSDGKAVSRAVAGNGTCPGALLSPAGRSISSLGLPQGSTAAPADQRSEDGAGPPIISAVHVEAAGFYHIDLLGSEKLGDGNVYHLKLHAYRDSNTHPLTDLYVDPETFLIREARGEAAGRYVIASGRVAGIVDFARVGDYWLVSREQFDIAANALLVHLHMNATIDASNVATADELPGVVFPAPDPTPASPSITTAGTRP